MQNEKKFYEKNLTKSGHLPQTLAADLKQQLDEARKTKASMGELPQGGVAARAGTGEGKKEAEEVVLTRTDRSGMVRPLPAREYPDETQGGKRRKKQKVQKWE